jgi:hypothetical protein
MASVIGKRDAALEATQQRRTPRRGLSSERRKYLTDKAVAGDQEAYSIQHAGICKVVRCSLRLAQ